MIYPWEREYKMTLYITGDVESNTVEVEGDSVEKLKEKIDELILSAVSYDGKYFVEMLIEENGEYYDSDESEVYVRHLERKVLYGGMYDC